MYTRKDIYNFAEQEVVGKLNRAIYISVAETEGQWLGDRNEPWLELFRPLSHNTTTRMFYWPEMAV